jgi:hypothetical protein
MEQRVMSEKAAIAAQVAAGLAVVGIARGAGQTQLQLYEVLAVLLLAETVLSAFWLVLLLYRDRIWRKRVRARDHGNEVLVALLDAAESRADALVDLLIQRGVLNEADSQLLDSTGDEVQRLWRFMRGRFNTTELHVLAVDADIEWENVEGTTLETRMASLIGMAKRTGKLSRLGELARQRRPE